MKRSSHSRTSERRVLAPGDHAIIRACLADSHDLVAALDECFSRTDPDDYGHSAQQLFGFLYRRLVDEDLDHPTKPALGRVYKRTWHQTQLLIFRARPLFARLEALGARPLVLKGGAMASSAYYDDLGVRPLMDLDVLVDRPLVAPLVDWAEANGWRVSKGLDARDFYLVHHAIDLEDGAGGAVDVHWALLVQGRDATRDLELVHSGESATLNDLPIEVLPPTFQLFHTVAHAKPEGIRHLVDVVNIVRAYPDQIDWDLLVDEVLTRRTISYAQHTLDLVEQIAPDVIPAAAHQRLAEATRHWSDYEFHGTEIRSRREGFRRLAADVSSRARGESLLQKARVARAMVHRFAQSNELSGRDLVSGLLRRGPRGLRSDDS